LTSTHKFSNVWDALEEDPVKAQNMKLRSELMMAITETIVKKGLNQTQTAQLLGISQPRVSDLNTGKIDKFRLDALVNFAYRLELKINLEIAA
jgi:predicted XRE-type DNA-binding protein